MLKNNRSYVFAISGVKNSGKTTLITSLIPVLNDKGYRVAVIKHDGHDFQADVPGKDSYRHKEAGAHATVIFSGTKYMTVVNSEEACETQFIELFSDIDIIILEGFKDSQYKKLEVVRSSNSSESVCDPNTLMALITDGDLTVSGIPVFNINSISEIADFIEKKMLNARGAGELFRSIPKIDEMLGRKPILELIKLYGYEIVINQLRRSVEEYRLDVAKGNTDKLFSAEILESHVCDTLRKEFRNATMPVINATGVVLHTNLGRAVLSEGAAKAVYEVAKSYSSLEMDVESGLRSKREKCASYLLSTMCGYEGALVVNNNAAAVMLVLAAIANEKEVVVSRGELVEIGGAFRVPDIMRMSGAILKEVGTTNKTRISDYEQAISRETAAILKIHPSNFTQIGFTEEADIAGIIDLAKEKGIHSIYDLGSGGISSVEGCAIPDVRALMALKPSIVCFSGDKLFGGPQSGIILGKKALIDKISKHPLARAFRVDKFTLAALEATLLEYSQNKRPPTLDMLGLSNETLYTRAHHLLSRLLDIPQLKVEIIQSEGEVGGGSLPGKKLFSICLALFCEGILTNELESRLRKHTLPIIGRIYQDKVLLDMRTIFEWQYDEVAEGVRRAVMLK